MGLLDTLIGPVTSIIDKIIPDKDQAAKLAHEIATMADTHAQQLALGQLKVNEAEAASGSLFKGGWRPSYRLDMWTIFILGIYLTALYCILSVSVWGRSSSVTSIKYI
jgi:hypothetical protein